MSRKVGASPERTRKGLVEAATAEFLDKGYRKASLRDICSKAGVTTGALYFFFDSKDALFKEIIDPVLSEIKEMIAEYYQSKLESISSKDDKDLAFGARIIRYYYRNKDICDIILTNRSYPVISDFFDEVIDYMDTRMTELQKLRNANMPDRKVLDWNTRHWLSHLQIDSLLEVITHTPDLESALKQIAVTITFIKSGYRAII